MTEFKPATRALEEMLKRSFDASLKDDKGPRTGPCAFDKYFHTAIIQDEESFDFPIIEWCDDDGDNVVKSDDSQFQSLHPSHHSNVIAAQTSFADDCGRTIPCLTRCQSYFADLAILGSLSMECLPYSKTNFVCSLRH